MHPSLIFAQQLIKLSNQLLELEAESLPAYIGLFLSNAARTELLTKVTPGHIDLHADHVTVLHAGEAPSKVDFVNSLAKVKSLFKPGDTVDIKVLGMVNDADAQAVVVELPPALANLNPGKIFHITISTATGVPPKYSNELVQNTELDTSHPPFPFIIKGTVDTFPSGKL